MLSRADLKKEYQKQYMKDYILKNRIKLLLYKKEYRKIHKLEIQEKNKIYHSVNKENNNLKRRILYLKNKQKIDNRNKIWRLKNKNKLNNYYSNKLKTDINYKIKTYERNRIYSVLKGNKKSKHTLELLGCSIEFLKGYLESQFLPGMNWKNYGNGWNGKGMTEWHIDHKKPCSSYDLSNPGEQALCFHYTNLQPLWAKDNLIKNDKWESEL
jgi:hypothetical protein